MTPTQLSTLKSVALSDQVAAGYITNGNDTELANWFNEQTATVAWRSSLNSTQARDAIIQGATQLDALTVGKRDSLFYLASGDLNVANASVRAAIDDMCGTQNVLKGFLQSAMKRTTNRAEKALASGTGTSVSPATLTYEGSLNGNDATDIRTSQ